MRRLEVYGMYVRYVVVVAKTLTGVMLFLDSGGLEHRRLGLAITLQHKKNWVHHSISPFH